MRSTPLGYDARRSDAIDVLAAVAAHEYGGPCRRGKLRLSADANSSDRNARHTENCHGVAVAVWNVDVAVSLIESRKVRTRADRRGSNGAADPGDGVAVVVRNPNLAHTVHSYAARTGTDADCSNDGCAVGIYLRNGIAAEIRHPDIPPVEGDPVGIGANGDGMQHHAVELINLRDRCSRPQGNPNGGVGVVNGKARRILAWSAASDACCLSTRASDE